MFGETFAFDRQEAANALRVSLRTLDALLADGTLRRTRIGRRVVIAKTEVQRFLGETAAVSRPVGVSRPRAAVR